MADPQKKDKKKPQKKESKVRVVTQYDTPDNRGFLEKVGQGFSNMRQAISDTKMSDSPMYQAGKGFGRKLGYDSMPSNVTQASFADKTAITPDLSVINRSRGQAGQINSINSMNRRDPSNFIPVTGHNQEYPGQLSEQLPSYGIYPDDEQAKKEMDRAMKMQALTKIQRRR